MKRIRVGETIEARTLTDIRSEPVAVPDPARLVHLQLRRFAGCPVCNLHLHSLVARHEEIVSAGIREVVVFHSTRAAMLPFEGDLPFAAIADPAKRLYAELGVGTSLRAVLSLRVMAAVVRGIMRGHFASPARGESALGLPADFLIASDGRVLALHYGTHASDHWSVDDLLRLARQHGAVPDHARCLTAAAQPLSGGR